jgi:hypothetical protein
MDPETNVLAHEQRLRNAMVKDLNKAKISTKDFIRVIEECEKRSSGDDWEPGDGLYVIVFMFRKKPRKAQAIHFRIDAMNDLLTAGAIPGYFALPKNGDGGIPIREAVLAAAATEPLIVVNDQIGFDRESFVRRCLQLTEASGGIQ